MNNDKFPTGLTDREWPSHYRDDQDRELDNIKVHVHVGGPKGLGWAVLFDGIKCGAPPEQLAEINEAFMLDLDDRLFFNAEAFNKFKKKFGTAKKRSAFVFLTKKLLSSINSLGI